MITAAYAQEMARYNRWQNGQISDLAMALDIAELTRDRGAFFGSILGTLSHLLWADRMWLSRFDKANAAPNVPGSESARFCADLDDWRGARQDCDDKITSWAASLGQVAGDLRWYSGLSGREMSAPFGRCITHFFNHQTHHRGQVHAMLTAAGQPGPVSDLIFMPDGV